MSESSPKTAPPLTGNQSYDQNQGALREWPHSNNVIEETLSVDLIEGRAKQLLFRSLNNKNLIAFVGTGVSAAYGRMSWSQLRDKQVNDIQRTAHEFSLTSEHSIRLIHLIRDGITQNQSKNTPQADAEKVEKSNIAIILHLLQIKSDQIYYLKNEIKDLLKTFDGLNNGGYVLGGEIYPIQFQIAKRLQDALQRAEKLFVLREETTDRRRGKPLEHNNFKYFYEQCEYGFQIDNRSDSFIAEKIAKLFIEIPDAEILKTNFKNSFRKYFETISIRGANLRFLDYTKQLIYDECAHAEYILSSALEYGAKSGRPELEDLTQGATENLHRTDEQVISDHRLDTLRKIAENYPDLLPGRLSRHVKGIRDDPTHYSALGFFKKDPVRDLASILLNDKEYRLINEQGFRKFGTQAPNGPLSQSLPASRYWDSIFKKIQEKCTVPNVGPSGNRRTIWTPTRRFVVGMMLTHLNDPLLMDIWGLQQRTERQFKQNPDERGEEKDPPVLYSPVESTDFKNRTSIIHDELDPLQKISLGLNIRQFLTTNYDLEIERLLQDRGYSITGLSSNGSEATGADKTRTDHLGGLSTDTTFRRKHAADLVSFSLDMEGADASVFHLHGRATHDSDIVLTERDYMDLYLKTDQDRDLVDEAIELAFSGNPVLFLGIGMSESDVLRPLRQFVSDQERRGDRTSIALLPASGKEAVQIQESATLFTRYGVHAIYFGYAHMSDTDEPIRWLQYISEFVNFLKSNAKSSLETFQKLVELAQPDHNPVTKAQKSPEEIISELNENFFPERSGEKLHNYIKTKIGTIKNQDTSINGEDKKKIFAVDIIFDTKDTNAIKPKIPFIKIGNESDYLDSVDLELDIISGIHNYLMDMKLGALLKSALDHSRSGSDPFPDSTDVEVLHRHIREIKAAVIGLEGAIASIYSALLCAQIEVLKQEWTKWWKDWRENPEDRKPIFEAIEPYGKTNSNFDLPLVYIRHHIDNAITNFDDFSHEASGTEPVYTGVRAFDTFIQSLSAENRKSRNPNRQADAIARRRLFLIAAHRGLGKGVFLSAFLHKSGLDSFIKHSWPVEGGSRGTGPKYIAAIFVNYSFSTEIASTWDMILSAWEESILELVQSQKPETILSAEERRHARLTANGDQHLSEKQKFSKLVDDHFASSRILPRLARLEYLINELRHWARNTKSRILLCLNAVDLLYDEAGKAKNREVSEFIRILASEKFQDIPYDLILIGEEAKMPKIFSLDGEERTEISDTLSKIPTQFRVISRSGLTPFGAKAISKRLERTGLCAEFEPFANDGGPSTTKEVCGPNYLHFCRVMQPEIFLIDNFIPLAAILFLKYVYDTILFAKQNITTEEPFNRIIIDLIIHLLNTTQLNTLNKSSIGSKQRKSEIFITISSLMKDINYHCSNLSNNNFKDTKLSNFIRKKIPTIENPEIDDNGIASKDIKRILRRRYGKFKDHSFDDTAYSEWREIRNKLRHNRFSVTLILAAAEKLALSTETVLQAGQNAELFIRSVIDRVSASSVERREEVIVHHVLDMHETFHIAGSPEQDINLHLSILRHLAVIGQPCSADVLIRVPEIRDYFDRIPEEKSDDPNPALRRRTDDLNNALAQLNASGLVFKLHPHPRIVSVYRQGDGETQNQISEDPKSSYRYALHRLIQRHVMRKMGGSLKEFVDSNSFACSLYASMPSELPRPTHDAYQFLRQLVASLSEYPDRYVLEEPSEPWHFGTAEYPTRVQALRAALGVLRSTFSIAVVSRFEDYKTLGVEWLKHAGYFEEHRIQIRWLLRKAWRLGSDEKKRQNKDAPREEKWDRINAFYRDETVWLFNECGLICLVQGNLIDAVPLFRNALELNNEIEGHAEDGPEHCRISLNLAIAQIERARLSAAKPRLENILRHEKPNSVVHALAMGYLGLVDHLQGHFSLAKKKYANAIKHLKKVKDSRACSIFCRHSGDLARLVNDTDRADSLLTESIAFAESGGHEDLLKKSKLAKIHAELERSNSFQYRTYLKQILIIEDYAETMDMPTLSCEASHLRARLLLDQGEGTLAGKLLQKTIAKAKRNGMDLRLGASLTLYGDVMKQRGQAEAAKRILITALEMAKNAGVQIEINRIEAVLSKL